jgi:plasmid stabilization system protein ParE
MIVRLSSDAWLDLVKGHHFYERRCAGLGSEFYDHMVAECEKLQETAGIHRKVTRLHFRMLAERFPFGVFYRIDGQTVVVLAILDLRQHPAKIQQRLRPS